MNKLLHDQHNNFMECKSAALVYGLCVQIPLYSSFLISATYIFFFLLFFQNEAWLMKYILEQLVVVFLQWDRKA